MDQTVKKRIIFNLLIWSGLLLTVLGFVGMVVLQAAGCQNLFNLTSLQPAQAYGYLTVPVFSIGMAVLGMLLLYFHPDNHIGWLALAMGMFVALVFLSLQYRECSLKEIISQPDNLILYWIANPLEWFMVMSVGLFVWLFPNGRFLSRRWQLVAWLMIGVLLILSLLTFFWPTSLFAWTTEDLMPEVQNPLALPFTPNLFWETVIFTGRQWLSNSFQILGFLLLGLRGRRAQGDERQQIKVFALFAAVAGTLFLTIEVFGGAFYPAIFDGWFYLFTISLVFLGLPIVFGIAIFKYRLYDIDIIIRRTVQYAIVSAVLAIVYFGSITLIQGGLTAVTDTQSPLAIVLSTLLIAALFNPLRQRVQAFIDRRFYRQKYNAQQVLAQFAQTARDEVEMEALQTELLRVVQETMQPNHISIWVKHERRN